MDINGITNLIEAFAPIENQEGWDCCGFQIDSGINDIRKVLLCLSVTENIINQAVKNDCDLIIAHHPLFFIPFSFKQNISIYSAHTNLDKANGGTTDTLIELLGFTKSDKIGEFLRLVDLKDAISLDSFVNLLKTKLNLKTLRVVNNHGQNKVKKIAFCAGSGSDFIQDAEETHADVIVTGDVKYHSALDSNVIIMDIGHFESEYPVLKTIEKLLRHADIGVIIANEKSPFINY